MRNSIETIINNYKSTSIKERDLEHLELCKLLKPIMNQVHNMQFSERCWAIILSSYVTSCLSRKSYFSKKDMPISPLFLPINGMGPPSNKQIIESSILYTLRAFNNSASLKKVSKILKKHDNICIGARGQMMEKHGIGIYCPPFYIIPNPINKINSKRKVLISIANKQEDIFLKNLINNIPTYFIEYFDSVLNKIPLYQPENKTFHGFHFPVFMEVMVAYYIEHGAKYYQYQDGGFRGETYQSVKPGRYFQYDKHRTYGWTLTDKDEPFYALRLHEFKLKYESLSEKIQNDMLIVYDKVNKNKKEKYYFKSKKIFDQINKRKYPHIKLRPRGKTKIWNSQNELSFLDAPIDVKVDKGKVPLAYLVRQSYVVVHLNHPSTNFLECVYVDHPVVAILTNENSTHIVEPYYDFFLKYGVMHKDVESLIDHLNKVNINEWWKNILNKTQYQEFKAKFAKKVPE